MLSQIVGSSLRRLPVRQFTRTLAMPASSDKPATTPPAQPASGERISLAQTHRPNEFEKKVRIGLV